MKMTKSHLRQLRRIIREEIFEAINKRCPYSGARAGRSSDQANRGVARCDYCGRELRVKGGKETYEVTLPVHNIQGPKSPKSKSNVIQLPDGSWRRAER